MALSYGKIKNDNKSKLVRKEDVSSEKKYEVEKEIKNIFVDTRYLLRDKDKNIWIYSPIDDSYYLYYNEKENKYMLDLYPTANSTICPECKLGLRLYKSATAGSETIRRISQNEKIQVSSDFKVDNSGDIWVHVIQMDNLKNPKTIEEGWIIYKNYRNNFVNILFESRTTNVTTNGLLDTKKVNELSSELFLMKNSEKYYGKNFLQFFAKSSIGNGKSAEIVSADTIAYSISTTKRKFNETYWEEKYNSKTESNEKKKSIVFNPDIDALMRHGPSVVLNAYKFPKYLQDSDTKENKEKNTHHPVNYDYSMNYEEDNLFKEPSLSYGDLKTDMEKLYKDINLDIRDEKSLYKKMFESYNRFKLPNPDDFLSRSFAHVFFTRPDCNVLSEDGKSMADKVKSNANFDYAWCHRKRLVTNLSMTNKDQDFNLFLSNKAEEFSLTDESISTATTGLTYHKQQIAYGKGNHESKANGEFTIKYTDNRFLDIFHFHKLWTDYIANVYSGLWYPKRDYLWMKTLDYPCSVYYILTAEDGETILFWSKYYGVFPTNVPSSSYSWSKGNVLTSPEVSITYQYSMKEDFNPISLVEFNLNSRIDTMSKVEYEPVFDEELGSSGYTWVGRPFIETVTDDTDGKDYYFKLRFKKQ